jgi:hypothetical protein
MPFRYYTVSSEHAHFIMIDSSSIIFDVEQQKWLSDVYQKLNDQNDGKWLILVSHHPLEYYGPRRMKTAPEWHKYQFTLPSKGIVFREPIILKPNQRDDYFTAHEYVGILTIGGLIKFILEQNAYKFDAVLSAHEHSMVISDIQMNFSGGQQTGSIMQIISGGGGAPLNVVDKGVDPTTRLLFAKKEHGYVHLSITKDQLKFHNVYITKPYHSRWFFNKNKTEAERNDYRDNIVTVEKSYKNQEPKTNYSE